MLLTANKKKVLRLLCLNKDLSVNEVAKECKITPNGAYKILKKLEKEEVLKVKEIANIKAYKLNFSDKKTLLVLQLAFMSDNLSERIRLRAEDVAPLKEVTSICILFGSYITEKQKPGDLDALLVLEKKEFKQYKQIFSKVQDIVPIKIQDIIQTREDLKRNLLRNDPIVLEAVRNGIVLWGYETLAEVIKNVAG